MVGRLRPADNESRQSGELFVRELAIHIPSTITRSPTLNDEAPVQLLRLRPPRSPGLYLCDRAAEMPLEPPFVDVGQLAEPREGIVGGGAIWTSRNTS